MSSYAVQKPTNSPTKMASRTAALSAAMARRSACAASLGSQRGGGPPGGANSHSYIGTIRSTSSLTAGLTTISGTREISTTIVHPLSWLGQSVLRGEQEVVSELG